MRWPKTAMLLAATVPLASAVAAPDPLAIERDRLRAAKADAIDAANRAADLARRAAEERNAAAKARAEEATVAARIERAEAEIAAARARVTIVGTLLARQRAALGERQAPVARLMAALASLARRPAAAAVVQPGSVTDLVHVRAVLGSTLPAIRSQTTELRDDLAQTRALQASAALAAESLANGRQTLVQERSALAALRARHAQAATQLGRDSLIQSDRAIAMGEAARDIVDRMAAIGETQATLEELAPLAGPPASAGGAAAPAVYRLPVQGRLVTGFGEVIDNGVRARGLTFAVEAKAPVLSPAAGRVVFARPFRRFGTIVIVDHGAGWNSLVTGLGAAAVRRGTEVIAGQPLGRAPDGTEPRVTIELRRRGRPVDAAALIG
ncbi:murein hydrolase activator EnvC family protein [Sphingomonas radiodurans]|uniref:murein hydrolase activator EnvC family protein n=1 Tax=Sphingomonas radiodurans TaxID=2890321 RepID=UPI001E4B90CB|nr:peptidoglycan DD-metalloendopeptidase family protein [Sphingomonas radiodurans]WBH16093.1 peptidoglycan DD-metalloendopeptidase family protein [Sphingomonas radiodurans]